MITKDELIKKIEEAIITEENAVELYAQHLKVILTWSGLDKKEQNEVKGYLDVLINESNEHKRAFDLIKKEIEKRDYV